MFKEVTVMNFKIDEFFLKLDSPVQLAIVYGIVIVALHLGYPSGKKGN